jgi:hypothetical protein
LCASFQRQTKWIAELAFESVLKSSPSNLKTIEYLGDIAGHNKSWDKAIGYYKN